MENLTITGYGNTNGGTFDKVNVNGCGVIKDNVIAKNVGGAGSAHFEGSLITGGVKYVGDILIEKQFDANTLDVTGQLRVKGDSNCKDTTVTGGFYVLGNYKGKNITITGPTTFLSNCTCTNFKVTGNITLKGELCAEVVIIKTSKADISEIHAEAVEIKKALSITKPKISIKEIECTNIVAETIECKRLCVENAKLTKNCVIDYLEYSGEIDIDDSCKVNELVKL